MIDNIKIRRLENGYTLRYHVREPADQRTPPDAGWVKEEYVSTKEKVGERALQLLKEYL